MRIFGSFAGSVGALGGGTGAAYVGSTRPGRAGPGGHGAPGAPGYTTSTGSPTVSRFPEGGDPRSDDDDDGDEYVDAKDVLKLQKYIDRRMRKIAYSERRIEHHEDRIERLQNEIDDADADIVSLTGESYLLSAYGEVSTSGLPMTMVPARHRWPDPSFQFPEATGSEVGLFGSKKRKAKREAESESEGYGRITIGQVDEDGDMVVQQGTATLVPDEMSEAELADWRTIRDAARRIHIGWHRRS